MFIASQKRKENVAEYLLYMWQIEDIIRANDLDIDKIKTNVIDKFQLDADQRKQMVEWYAVSYTHLTLPTTSRV